MWWPLKRTTAARPSAFIPEIERARQAVTASSRQADADLAGQQAKLAESRVLSRRIRQLAGLPIPGRQG